MSVADQSPPTTPPDIGPANQAAPAHRASAPVDAEAMWCRWEPTSDTVTVSPPVVPTFLGAGALPARSRDLRALVGSTYDERLMEFMLSVASDPADVVSDVMNDIPSRTLGRKLRIHAARLGPAGSSVTMLFDISGSGDDGAARAADLETRRLRRRVGELEQEVDHLSQYVSVIAHDLRAPLQSMCNLIDLVEARFGESLPPEALKILQLVNQTANQSAGLTRDVLAHARLGTSPLEPVDVDLIEVAHELWPSLRPPDASLRVPPDARVRGDWSLLRRLIGTLLDNSVKYRTERPLFVGISLEDRANEWCVTVADNGRGMPAGRHAECFELFRRHEAQVEGTGMGLAIARRIVELHGGEIWAEPRTPHHGTKIVFTLAKRRTVDA